MSHYGYPQCITQLENTIHTNNIGRNNVDNVAMPTLASATCLAASQRSPNKTTCKWWVASSVSILITLRKSSTASARPLVSYLRGNAAGPINKRAVHTYKGDGVIATTTYARAFLFVRNGRSSEYLIANHRTLLQRVTSRVPARVLSAISTVLIVLFLH